MKCHYCANEATVTLTEIIQKQKKELYLCAACAREHHVFPEQQQELNINALLKFLIGQPGFGLGKSSESNQDACPNCGMKYAQFRAQGRLGCPDDYENFRTLLTPLLQRIHRSLIHQGKVPRRVRAAQRLVERQELERQLRDAIAVEAYEEAGRLRDRIRSMETNDEPR
jgi:protein arginine kinase activator